MGMRRIHTHAAGTPTTTHQLEIPEGELLCLGEIALGYLRLGGELEGDTPHVRALLVGVLRTTPGEELHRRQRLATGIERALRRRPSTD